jgi:hypothetical protein
MQSRKAGRKEARKPGKNTEEMQKECREVALSSSSFLFSPVFLSSWLPALHWDFLLSCSVPLFFMRGH